MIPADEGAPDQFASELLWTTVNDLLQVPQHGRAGAIEIHMR